MQPNLLALYGLKFNPFAQDIPVKAVFLNPKLDGASSTAWHAKRLCHGCSMGSINHPQSSLSDFYRELSDILAVPIESQNRWGGFKAQRGRWLAHLQASRRRCVLLIDEAQGMSAPVLSELPCWHRRCCALCSPAMPACVRNPPATI
ncbi:MULTISPECIES: ATP-binding protein [Cupriavidus]|nr:MULTISPECIES: ATP-binding protein [Cupriavidus]MCO4865976.1 ATP-binding protein [Cupriavidus sp. WGlv3]MCO4893635.1 ATP-binding protein [Cupriavidus sp. WGtm5]